MSFIRFLKMTAVYPLFSVGLALVLVQQIAGLVLCMAGAVCLMAYAKEIREVVYLARSEPVEEAEPEVEPVESEKDQT